MTPSMGPNMQSYEPQNQALVKRKAQSHTPIRTPNQASEGKSIVVDQNR